METISTLFAQIATICHSAICIQYRPLVARPENSLLMLTLALPFHPMEVRSHSNIGFPRATRQNSKSPTAMVQANVCLLWFMIPVSCPLVRPARVGHRTAEQLFFPNSWSESKGDGSFTQCRWQMERRASFTAAD